MNQHRTHSAGFTLIELMVSIAIALLLILGVNEVFRISSETAGQGQALSTISRDDRAIQNTLTEDMKNIVPVASDLSPTAEGPFTLIDSRLQPAFRNAKDKAGAADPNNPLFDPVVFANSSPLPQHWNPVLINYRSHRVDRLGFFARGLFPRQTASSVPGSGYVSNTTGSEAYIWYGHASLPGSNNTYYDPGFADPANTSNRYASDFLLCREAILLVPSPFDVNYLTAWGKGGNNAPLAPLGWGSPSNDPAGYIIQNSRYDLADSSIQQFASQKGPLASYYRTNPTNWWYPLLFDMQRSRPGSLVPWRFQADPFMTKPAGYTGAKVTAASMALASPCLVRGCSQFIVEFAGNFYTKNDNGSVKDRFHPDPSGQLDFSADLDPVTRLYTLNRQIRWYGFPRDTNGDGVINYRDVMPLYQFLGNAINISNKPLDDIEDVSNLPSPQSPPYDASNNPQASCDYARVFGSDASAKYSYTAAWGPSSKLPFPKMIRVTVAIDDPNGRLGEAQVFEYVFDVQQ